MAAERGTAAATRRPRTTTRARSAPAADADHGGSSDRRRASAADAGPTDAATVRASSRARSAASGTPRKPASDAAAVAGITITHPERVLYPEAGITKGDIAQYYVHMASELLPYVRNRPLSLVRCPQGAAASCFFQKHATEQEIPGIGYVMITESGGEKPYVLASNPQALAGLAQMGTLELHAWNATADDVEHADTLVFDFDPDAGLGFAQVVAAALECRAALAGLGLQSYAKTTGAKGLHVVVPLAPRVPWDTAKRFARALADRMQAGNPDRFVTKALKAARKGRIFIDYLRNARGATAVAPYSVRARPGATVAVPLYWNELCDALDPATFTVRTVPARIARGGDPWAGYHTHRQTITAAMLRDLERVSSP